MYWIYLVQDLEYLRTPTNTVFYPSEFYVNIILLGNSHRTSLRILTRLQPTAQRSSVFQSAVSQGPSLLFEGITVSMRGRSVA